MGISHITATKVIDLNSKPQQKLTEWQAFSKLKWEVLKGDFESDWMAFKESSKDSGHKVAWRRQWLINKLKNSTKDIWKEVAEYMKAEIPSEQEGSEAARYQRCVEISCIALTGS
jgi:hypothetical protein